MNKDVWTIKRMLDWGSGYFSQNQVENPRLNIEHLLAGILNKKRIELYVEFERVLNGDELSRLKTQIQKRVKGEPLQYILGNAEFYHSAFKVAPGALIPRPETEMLVDEVVQEAFEPFSELERAEILDLGAGCGNIGLSVIKALPNAFLTAVDISEAALALARNNAADLGLTGRCRFFQGSWFEPLPEEAKGKFHIIVSNPPYVSEKEFETLETQVKDFEPREALVGGSSGLEQYELIIPQAASYLTDLGVLAFEVGMGQAQKVKDRMEENQFKDVKIIPDLAGIDRIVMGHK